MRILRGILSWRTEEIAELYPKVVEEEKKRGIGVGTGFCDFHKCPVAGAQGIFVFLRSLLQPDCTSDGERENENKKATPSKPRYIVHAGKDGQTGHNVIFM